MITSNFIMKSCWNSLRVRGKYKMEVWACRIINLFSNNDTYAQSLLLGISLWEFMLCRAVLVNCGDVVLYPALISSFQHNFSLMPASTWGSVHALWESRVNIFSLLQFPFFFVVVLVMFKCWDGNRFKYTGIRENPKHNGFSFK